MKQTRTIRVLHYSLAPLSCGGFGGAVWWWLSFVSSHQQHTYVGICNIAAAALLRSDTFSKITSPSYPALSSPPAQQALAADRPSAFPGRRRGWVPILGCHKLVRQAQIAIV